MSVALYRKWRVKSQPNYRKAPPISNIKTAVLAKKEKCCLAAKEFFQLK